MRTGLNSNLAHYSPFMDLQLDGMLHFMSDIGTIMKLCQHMKPRLHEMDLSGMQELHSVAEYFFHNMI